MTIDNHRRQERVRLKRAQKESQSDFRKTHFWISTCQSEILNSWAKIRCFWKDGCRKFEHEQLSHDSEIGIFRYGSEADSVMTKKAKVISGSVRNTDNLDQHTVLHTYARLAAIQRPFQRECRLQRPGSRVSWSINVRTEWYPQRLHHFPVILKQRHSSQQLPTTWTNESNHPRNLSRQTTTTVLPDMILNHDDFRHGFTTTNAVFVRRVYWWSCW